MTGSDEEFEDFLKRRKPIFRAPDDMFEPPAELDRVVLRQARDAIETERPLRVFRAPSWAAPVALAATLVLAFGVVFQAGMPAKRKVVPEVTVQNVAERVDLPETAPPAPAASSEAANHSSRGESDANGSVVVDLSQPTGARREAAPAVPLESGGSVADANSAPVSGVDGGLVSREEADRYAASPPPAAPVARGAADAEGRARRTSGATMDAPPVVVTVPAAKATENPAWRRDAKTWLAEIERLRNAGDTARANAELEEYKRQHRAYAVAPDR
jgi:hypothetical protein